MTPRVERVTEMLTANVYGKVKGVVRPNVSLTHEQAVWLSKQDCVAAVVCETSFHGFKTIYENGMMRQWDSAGRIVSGDFAPFDERLGHIS